MSFVAMVTGATRGLGRGTARGLASKGATVAFTGRDKAALDDVASEVEAAGGKALPILCDHGDDDAVKAAFETLQRETGQLDLLINNAAHVNGMELIAPGGFWEKSLDLADMITVGLRSAYVASYYAAPMMVEAGRGLIASISFYGAVGYFHGAAYGAAKAGTDKMAFDMHVDLAPHGVSSVSFWPGFILTDALRAMPPEMIPPDLKEKLPFFETPEFTGLVLHALATDPKLAELSGQALIGAELGQRYGITDTDGKQPIDYRAIFGGPATFNRGEAQ